MNFIIRNLGWILLIIFFVFMLFLISNQNNSQGNTSINGNGSGTKVNQSELVKEIITEEIEESTGQVKEVENNEKKLLEDTEKKINSSDVLGDKSTGSNTVVSTGGIVNSIKDFFTIKKVDTLTGTTINGTGEVTQDLIKEVEIELNNKIKEVQKNEPTINNERSDQKVESKLKNITDKSIAQNVQNIEKNDTLATYEIGVKSMFLNNAWFTKRVGVLYKGDVVKQLTKTNKYGCFKVKVISSSNSDSNGKIAWACKYYMKGYQGSLSSYKSAANQYYKNMKQKVSKSIVRKSVKKYVKAPAKIVSKVGTIYSVKTHSLKLNNQDFTKIKAYLLRGDKVEQLTNANSAGCFKVSVYSSNNTTGKAQGKSGWVCKKYLK